MSEENSYTVPQEIDNINDLMIYAVDKVIEQGERSVNDDDVCVYRKDNLKCAVGFMISDEYYNESFVDESIDNVQVRSSVSDSVNFTLTEQDYEYLKMIQDAHDSSRGDFVNIFKGNIYSSINDYGGLPDIFFKDTK